MTFKRFIFLGLFLWALLAAFKFFMFRVLDSSSPVNQTVYLLLTFLAALGCVRRLGVINYLEAMMVSAFWFLGVLAGDLVIVGPLLGLFMLKSTALWLGYVVMAAGIFFFHKKRHVHIRKEQAAHHHGGH